MCVCGGPRSFISLSVAGGGEWETLLLLPEGPPPPAEGAGATVLPTSAEGSPPAIMSPAPATLASPPPPAHHSTTPLIISPGTGSCLGSPADGAGTLLPLPPSFCLSLGLHGFPHPPRNRFLWFCGNWAKIGICLFRLPLAPQHRDPNNRFWSWFWQDRLPVPAARHTTHRPPELVLAVLRGWWGR